MEKSQTRFHRRLPAVALATLIAALLLVFVLVGLVSADTTINLNQDVSPPNAIKIGVGVEHYWWDITHDSYPDFWTVEIWDPSANTVKC